MNCPVNFEKAPRRPRWEKRAYQGAIHKALRKELKVHRCVLVVAPPNAGKTVIFEEEIFTALGKGKRVCVVLPNTVLLEQTIKRLAHFEPGIIRPRDEGKNPRPDAPLQIASVYCLGDRLEEYSFDLIVVDEAHHGAAKTWMKVLNRYADAQVIGFTATAKRLDGEGLGQCGFTGLVRGPWVDKLTPEYMAPYVYYAPNVPELLERPEGGDYTEKDLAAAGIEMGVLIGDAVTHYAEHTQGRSGLVFCLTRDHSRETVKQFEDAGFRARHLDGESSEDEREEILRQYEAREIHLIISCLVIGEGFDVPNVDVVIQLRPTRSYALWMQQIGRGFRQDPANPEKQLYIIDCGGNWYRFWAPCVDRQYGLDGSAEISEADEASDGRRCRCGACGFVGMPTDDGGCSQCGMEIGQGTGTREALARAGLRWRDGDLVRVGPWQCLRFYKSRESWRFRVNVGEKIWIRCGHRGMPETDVAALVARVNAMDPAPATEGDWWAALALPARVNVGRTTYSKRGKSYIFRRSNNGQQWCRNGHYEMPETKVAALVARVNAMDASPATEEDWWAALGLTVKIKAGCTTYRRRKLSWRFYCNLNGKAYFVQGHLGMSDCDVAALVARVNAMYPAPATEEEWWAALELAPKGKRKNPAQAVAPLQG